MRAVIFSCNCGNPRSHRKIGKGMVESCAFFTTKEGEACIVEMEQDGVISSDDAASLRVDLKNCGLPETLDDHSDEEIAHLVNHLLIHTPEEREQEIERNLCLGVFTEADAAKIRDKLKGAPQRSESVKPSGDDVAVELNLQFLANLDPLFREQYINVQLAKGIIDDDFANRLRERLVAIDSVFMREAPAM